MANLCLSYAVNATKPLLNAIRVPGKIVVDHQVRPLKVNPLTCSISREQHKQR